MTTLNDILPEFLAYKRRALCSDKTLRCYNEILRPFCDFFICKDIYDIFDNDINAYFDSLLSKMLASASYASYVRTIKIFLRWTSRNYSVRYDFTKIRVPKSPKKNVHIYSDDEISMIFGACSSRTEWITWRNRAIIALMLDSGLRQGEVCSLLAGNVRFNEHYMMVTGKGDKARVVPLGDTSALFLKIYSQLCPYDTEYMFCSKSGERLTENAVKLFVSKLSHKLPFEFSSHKLRHNFATNYCLDSYKLTGQVDIYKLMHLLGHEDINTTRVYLHYAYNIISAQNNFSHLDSALSNKDFLDKK